VKKSFVKDNYLGEACQQREWTGKPLRESWHLALTLILTAWEFKKPFFVKMKISPGWLKQNILKKSKTPCKIS
jgi:hypothetical protein